MADGYTEEGLRKLGDMLRQARRGRSYREFEAEIGLSHGTLRSLEFCTTNPDIRTLIKIGRYLGFRPEELQSLLVGKAPIEEKEYHTHEDLKAAVRKLPVAEAARLGQWIFAYLAGFDEHANGRNGQHEVFKR